MTKTIFKKLSKDKLYLKIKIPPNQNLILQDLKLFKKT